MMAYWSRFRMMVMTYRALDQILLEIQAMQSEQGLKRFWTFQKESGKDRGYEEEV